MIPAFWRDALLIAIRTTLRIWLAYLLVHSAIEFR
jgi:hypothetical protein